ncbi:NUDIX domain-containing protein [Myroides phaeus]|uniref:NUDIX hydrolase n=1 Tax=Myroides phaeus TaxID=702745 RepID=UPI002DB75D44|nr:NUDIX domain-containing protein [Myroides phaeus]MEC4117720.1 NUDIX domain-containing protein [Myroides phaeus]
MSTTHTIYLASALLTNDKNEMLTVRKKGSTYYMMAGGKIELGETPIETLKREIQEELQLNITNDQISLLGTHQTTAVNEANTIVNATIFHVRINNSSIQASAEIEEIKWVTKENYNNIKLAHLLKEFSLPIWLKMK